ncbi:hypothetical protein BQ8482_100106 [Mesorhizobium delmotii]|uniref:Uncharacterized protein n=1 Tax=Mesorhizobium delmotii TaxID=1631247 RepID=A0A2P9A9W6_9HYPH|nr:hypothetical protein BQ8482_100106 [Mesorhizobium delmotii]
MRHPVGAQDLPGGRGSTDRNVALLVGAVAAIVAVYISFDIRSHFEIIPSRFRKNLKMLQCEIREDYCGRTPDP